MPTTGGAFEYLAGDWAAEFRRRSPVRNGPWPSMLYVGHRSDTHPWWWQTFAPACGIKRLAVVDIVKANAESARHITDEIYACDVRDLSLPQPFDLVFWDEGPEHMAREDALRMIPALAGLHGQVLISCPWGYQPQGAGPNDPEFHHWGPQPADFQSIGMTVRTFGTEFDGLGHGHGNLIAWT